MTATQTHQYLQYLQPEALPAPKALPPLAHEEAASAPDLFLWCVNDITLKLTQAEATIPEDFRENLYRHIFAASLNIAFEEAEDLFPDSLRRIQKATSLEDVLTTLSSEIEASPELALVFNKALIAAYVLKCMEYAVSADQFISSILYK